MQLQAVVNSAYEWYGRLQEDPELEKHFGNSWEHSVGTYTFLRACSALLMVQRSPSDRSHSNAAQADAPLSRFVLSQIGVLVRRVLCQASEQGQSPVPVADALAEGLSRQLHPLWPGRARQVMSALVTHGWHRGHDFWRDRLHFVNTHGYA